MDLIKLSDTEKKEMGYYRAIEAINIVNEQHGEHFGDEDFPFRAAFMNVVNVYCGLVEQAGRGCMEIVRKLPIVEGKPLADAVVAYEILKETHEALESLLEDDAVFDESLRGGLSIDAERDRQISEEARAFDQEYKIDKEQEILKSAREGQISDAEISDAATKWKNAHREDNEVAASRRGDEDRMKETLRITSASNATPSSKHSDVQATKVERAEWEEPEEFDVTEPDFVGTSPNLCFRRATKWLADTIISISTGSQQKGRYPRLSPLLRSTVSEGPILPSEEVIELIASIRAKTGKLRTPNIDEFNMGEIMDSIGDGSDDSDGDGRDKLRKMMEQMGKLFKKGTEGEEWKRGRNDDDE